MAMERLADEGLCKSIGISNFSVAKSQELIQTCRHPPVVNQVGMRMAGGRCLPAVSAPYSLILHAILGCASLVAAHGCRCIAGGDAPILAPGQAVPLRQLHGETLGSLHISCMDHQGASSMRSLQDWNWMPKALPTDAAAAAWKSTAHLHMNSLVTSDTALLYIIPQCVEAASWESLLIDICCLGVHGNPKTCIGHAISKSPCSHFTTQLGS